MDRIYGNTFNGTGQDMKPLARAFRQLKGAIVTFGLGGSGKTDLAESLTSCLHEHALANSSQVIANDTVVDAALKSWFAPAFFTSAVNSGFLTGDYARDWAHDFLESVELNSLATIYNVCSRSDVDAASDLDRRLRYATVGGSLKGNEASAVVTERREPAYKFELGIDNDKFVGVHIQSSASVRTSLVVALPVSGRGTKPAFVLPGLPDNAERVDGDEFTDLLADYMTGLDFAVDVNKPEAWFCAELRQNEFVIDEGAQGHPIFTRKGGAQLCVTQHGVQVRTPDEVEKYEHHAHVSYESWMVELIEERLASDDEEVSAGKVSNVTEGKYESTFEDLLEYDPVMLLAILSESGVIGVALSRSARYSAIAHEKLQTLVRKLNLAKKPSLIMTEMKATAAYGATAYNKNIEAKGVELSLKSETSDDTMTFTADCSLVNAALGSLVLWPVTHISVLDLTLAFDIVFNSSTQKGGLDSSMLFIMQFLSNIASLANGHFVMETRDDFTVSNNEEEANERARSTLGANSRIAIQVRGSGSEARTIWIRIKGGDDINDAWIELFGVDREDYPQNMFREKEKSDILHLLNSNDTSL